ncbi:hypothetical protein BaRGS_00024677 [Batillaria attramentaria]|uniref:Uncharacterized protein n=1 Tax=Batillaria attramentaria TaxID=370345 RepID=A0ABD0KAG2_9CAEN
MPKQQSSNKKNITYKRRKGFADKHFSVGDLVFYANKRRKNGRETRHKKLWMISQKSCRSPGKVLEGVKQLKNVDLLTKATDGTAEGLSY